MADPIIKKLESCRTFPVSASCEGYPDVIFEIILDATPTQEQIEAAVSALTKFYYGYNILHFLRPIHYVAGVNGLFEREHPRGIYIYMDFGGASPYALCKAMRVIEKLDLPIFRVALL